MAILVQPTHRYGLRGMLSSLIWGSPSKKEEPAEQSEDGSDDGDEASQPDEQASAKQQSYTQRREVHEISDDEDEQDEVEETSRRFSSQDKGKGRAVPPPVCSSLSLGNGLELIIRVAASGLERVHTFFPDYGRSAVPCATYRAQPGQLRRGQLVTGPLLCREGINQPDCRRKETGQRTSRRISRTRKHSAGERANGSDTELQICRRNVYQSFAQCFRMCAACVAALS